MRSPTLFETIVIGGIPVLHVSPLNHSNQSVAPSPTIFLYHGWASRKETYKFVAEILALRGYRVVIPDAPLHGDRQQEKDLKGDFWNVIVQSVYEFDLLLRHARSNWGTEPEWTAIVGSSMGGFIAPGIFFQDPSLRGLVSVNGSGAWEESERMFRILDGRSPATLEEIQPIRQLDPIQFVAKTPPRPILLQHGEADTIIPIDGQRKFHQKLLTPYQGYPHLLEYQQIPRMNHYISLGMFEDIVLWLEQHVNQIHRS